MFLSAARPQDSAYRCGPGRRGLIVGDGPIVGRGDILREVRPPPGVQVDVDEDRFEDARQPVLTAVHDEGQHMPDLGASLQRPDVDGDRGPQLHLPQVGQVMFGGEDAQPTLGAVCIVDP